MWTKGEKKQFWPYHCQNCCCLIFVPVLDCPILNCGNTTARIEERKEKNFGLWQYHCRREEREIFLDCGNQSAKIGEKEKNFIVLWRNRREEKKIVCNVVLFDRNSSLFVKKKKNFMSDISCVITSFHCKN